MRCMVSGGWGQGGLAGLSMKGECVRLSYCKADSRARPSTGKILVVVILKSGLAGLSIQGWNVRTGWIWRDEPESPFELNFMKIIVDRDAIHGSSGGCRPGGPCP